MEITEKMAIIYAKEWHLEWEVQQEMENGISPEGALLEWDCYPKLKPINFGIDTDPWQMVKKYDFKIWLEEILGRPMPWDSCFFGCAEWNDILVTEKQHELIAKELIRYYNNGWCRGASCTDLNKFR